MRNSFITLVILCSFASLAAAQVPTAGNVFFGYSYYSTNLSSVDRANTNGWEVTAEGRVLPFIGIVGDFSAHYGTEHFAVVCPVGQIGGCPPNDFNISEHDYLFGPRASVSVGKVRPFAEFLIGAAHANANGLASDTSFATAIGGGLDYKILKPLAWRFQGDYLHTSLFGNGHNNVKIATGIVFRF